MYSLCKQNNCFRLLLVNLLEHYDTDVKCRRVKMTENLYHMPSLNSFRFCFPSSFLNTTVTKIQILNFNVNK